MKKFIVILNLTAVLGLLLPASASAQGTNGSSTTAPPMPTNAPPSFSNHFGLTNIVVWTNVPPGWTNHPGGWTNIPPAFTNTLPAFTNGLGWTNSVVLGTNFWWTNIASITNGFSPPGSTNAHHPHVTPPANVQTVIKQFNSQRAQLINQLKNSSDAQRQQVLQQLSALRDQLQDQMANWRQQALDQARDMKNHLNNSYAPGSGSGPASSGPATGRPGHN